MKTTSLSLIAGLLLATTGGAKPVDEFTARKVAAQFWSDHDGTGAADLQLVYRPLKKNDPARSTLYVFGAGRRGFVIISGDDALSPVLAYSTESAFDMTRLSPELACWLYGYEKAVSWVMDNGRSADEKTAAKWNGLLGKGSAAARTTGGASAVAPLLTTRWDQFPYYNGACPWDAAASTRAITGCTATAMAQIMRFWRYPAAGTGSHSYVPATNPQYGPLSVNFGAATYDYSAMPDELTSPNTEVAKLIYHAGVSVNMDYTPAFSGAWVISYGGTQANCSETALPAYFGYKGSIRGLEREVVAQQRDWTALLKMELNASRPVLYVGYDSTAGHAFVADGYDADDRLHINWGWSGNFNGYFSVNDMNPAPWTPGYSYNLWQEALVGIEPAQGAYNLQLDAAVVAPAVIAYNQPFAVSTALKNAGLAGFSGDYALRVFDTLGNVVDSLQIMANQSLASNASTGGLNFSVAGNAGMTPGVYWLGVYYRTAGGGWREAGETGTFTNRIPVTVTAPNKVPDAAGPLSVRIHPNPASEAIHVSAGAAATLRLLDLHGKVLATAAVKAGGEAVIPTAALPGGVYLLQVTGEGGVITKRVQMLR